MSEPSRQPADLSTPLAQLSGVGTTRATLLARLGLRTLQDAIFFFPRDYQTIHHSVSLDDLDSTSEMASVQGEVQGVDLRSMGRGKSMLGVLVRQGDSYLRAVWFNQPYLRDRFEVGQRVQLTGKPRLRGLRWEMHHPQVVPLDVQSVPDDRSELLPVYRLTEGVTQQFLRPIMRRIATEFTELVPETLPEAFCEEQDLLPVAQALRWIHVPQTEAQRDRARHRFVFQELLVMQLALAMKRSHQHRTAKSPRLEASTRIDRRIRHLIPFTLTPQQDQAVAEIVRDMACDYPMNRLLHGEVGSGKTVAAVYAMLLTVAHGYQAAIMAPTEVLARQHVNTLEKLLRHSEVNIQLFTGGMSSSDRQQALSQIVSGKADLIVGTQAILSEEVQFARLGLVVIDEQHKFGVHQRASLKQASLAPHYLVMTATPIPRTVTMTLYGDLDTSTLRDGPAGRKPVHTYWGQPAQREGWWRFFAEKLREGRQGYVITPLVEGSDESDALANVEQMYESLVNGPLAAFRVDLVHGRMYPREKQAAMDAFHSGRTQVLVATSVVEVGIDVPNANVMTIENSERFGLAQLHQLRGRVSRGPFPGFVCAFTGEVTEQGAERIQAFVDTVDGFQLAELDLQLRGPGDLFGTRQHGLPPLRVADLFLDREILEITQKVARELVATDPELRDSDLERLRRMVLNRYGATLDLSHVG